jgi:flavin reductase (DIM6/NTAB) family NADH-FMN oxidoreductase RutF
MDSSQFRQALGAFATGICLVTVRDDTLGSLAMTVNSFSSVSLEPALVLWSIQNSSDHLQIYTECPHFGISILTAEQAALSAHYAQRGGHSTLEEHFVEGPSGEPQLIGAHVHFTCATHAVYPGGDHQIILGEVLDMTMQDALPLVFYGGGYRGLS